MQEIVSNCTHGIDLHTSGRRRKDFPQIRAELNDPVVRAMAEAFGALGRTSPRSTGCRPNLRRPRHSGNKNYRVFRQCHYRSFQLAARLCG